MHHFTNPDSRQHKPSYAKIYLYARIHWQQGVIIHKRTSIFRVMRTELQILHMQQSNP